MKYNIYPIAYFEDKLQILLTKDKKLLQTTNNNIVNYIDKTLNININEDDILSKTNIKNNKISENITVIVLINLENAHKIKNADSYLWFNKKITQTFIPKNESEEIDNIITLLNERFTLYGLYGMKPLIPKKFTSKSITAQVNNMFGIHMKNNNIKRDYQDQINIIGKDKSNPGRPLWIFELKGRTDKK